MENNKKAEHRSTTRVLDILEIIAQNSSQYTLTDICRELDAPKSSLYPILQTLVARHYLAIGSNNHYRIDCACYQVGCSYIDHLNVMDEINNILRNITNVCLETTHFGILVEGDVLYLKKIDSPEPIRMIANIGIRIPAYGTAIGKSLLIDYSLNDLKHLYPNGLKALTEHTITDFKELAAQLKESRDLGYTWEIEESTAYIRCYSIPVRKNEKVVAALSVAIPIFRHSEEKESLAKSLLKDGKSKIEKLIRSFDIDFSSQI